MERNMATKFNDNSLIGLSTEEAYKRIVAAGLKTNLEMDKDGKVAATEMARIMLLMPDYLTVSYDKNNVVTKIKRG